MCTSRNKPDNRLLCFKRYVPEGGDKLDVSIQATQMKLLESISRLRRYFVNLGQVKAGFHST